MARQSKGRSADDAGQTPDDASDARDEPGGLDIVDGVDDDAGTAGRQMWEALRIDPIEIALPSGVGYTLRAYRLRDEVKPTDIADREDDDPFKARRHAHDPDEDDDTVIILDEEFNAMLAESDDEAEEASESRGGRRKGEPGPDGEVPDADDAAEEDVDEPDDIPVFLSHRGKLLLFKTAESLVTYLRSGAPNDLAQLDTYRRLASRIEPADVQPADGDAYELDLVVENLRGGHDAWDVNLLIQAGEISRDLGYALRLEPVIAALSPGSPLDDLDESLRAAAEGGVGGFFGRRRLRRIGAQQASLGWRTIIGKISAAVDWRD